MAQQVKQAPSFQGSNPSVSTMFDLSLREWIKYVENFNHLQLQLAFHSVLSMLKFNFKKKVFYQISKCLTTYSQYTLKKQSCVDTAFFFRETYIVYMVSPRTYGNYPSYFEPRISDGQNNINSISTQLILRRKTKNLFLIGFKNLKFSTLCIQCWSI